MNAFVSVLKAQSGKEDEVRDGLRALVGSADSLDPPSRLYTVLESNDAPGEFLILDEHEADLDSIQDADEELLKLGTALREALRDPLVVHQYRVIEAAPRAA